MVISKLKNKRILVLGASGQVGTELTKQLDFEGCKVTALRKSKWEEKLDYLNFDFINFDINSSNPSTLKKLVLDHDYIFHLAGNTEVQPNKDNENDYFLSWVTPLIGILDFMVDTDKVLLFASSCSVYGNTPILPVTDNTREEPLTSYDLAKFTCDNLIKYYRGMYGVLCSSLRFSNIYGPVKTSGSSDRKIINKILNHIHQNKNITLVEDGKFLRNYIHVVDCAAMLIHAAKEIKNSSPILLSCSNENILFRDVIEKLAKCYKERFKDKIDIKYGMEKRYLTDLRQFSGDPSLTFQKNFDFKYDLDSGLKELVDEFKEY